MLLDTNFLVCYSGQSKRLPRSRAVEFLRQHKAAPLYVFRVSVLEFTAGMDTAAQAARHLAGFGVLPVDEIIWLEATNAFRHLRRAGLKIGVADTLIAATALNYGLPVVTENAGHFGRLPGLTVLAY